MPKIINAYADGQNSIADSLKSIGQSIWGDEAKNEGYRQNAEKLRRENQGRQDAADAFRRGDYTGIGAGGIAGGMSGADAGAYSRLLAARNAGSNYDDPQLGVMSLGAGENMAATAEGQRRAMANQRAMEQDRTDAAKYSPIMSEDARTGVKSAAGAFNTRTGEYRAFGAQPQGFNQPMSAPGSSPQAAYTPADMITDDYGRPVSIPQAPLHMMGAADENGQPILDERGKQRLMQFEQQTPGYGKQLLATALGHVPAPSSRSKQNQTFMRDLLDVYPGYEAGLANMRNKTWQDIASSGKTGTMTTALGQFMNHLGEKYIPAVEGVGTVDTLHPFSGAGPISAAGNWVAGQGTNAYNAAHVQSLRNQGAPQITAMDAAQEAVANEYAKVLRTSGMAESDVQRNMAIFKPGNSPAQAKAAIDTALGVIHGAYASREGTIDRLLMAPHPPLVSSDTQTLEAQIKGWLAGGKAPVMGKPQEQMPQGPPGVGSGAAPATALPPGPAGHPPSINDTAPPPAPGARSSFDDRFSAAGEPPLIAQAREAIAAGKSRAAVIQRLQQMGVDPAGL